MTVPPILSRQPKPPPIIPPFAEPSMTAELTVLLPKPKSACPAPSLSRLVDPQQEAPDIWVYPDAFSEALCEHLIARFNAEPRKARKPRRSITSNEGYIENKRCRLFTITGDHDWLDVDQAVAAALGRVARHFYSTIYGIELPVADSGYDIGCYEPPLDHCAPHFDGGNNARLNSVIVYLNTVEEGGETIFPRQGVEVKPRRGAVLLFPPHFTYPHYVRPPVSNARYFICTWFTLKSARP